MIGYRRVGASVVGAVAAAALALGIGLAVAPVGTARAAPAPEFTLEFTDLQPGVPQTDSGTFTLDRAADLVSFAWIEQVGTLSDSIVFDVEACDSTGSCVDPTALTGPVPFAAGLGTLTVTAELTAAAGNGETSSSIGRLSFVADDPLALTGSDVAPWIAAGIAAVAVGALILALTRRRGDYLAGRVG
jgi:hypothetical protein